MNANLRQTPPQASAGTACTPPIQMCPDLVAPIRTHSWLKNLQATLRLSRVVMNPFPMPLPKPLYQNWKFLHFCTPEKLDASKSTTCTKPECTIPVSPPRSASVLCASVALRKNRTEHLSPSCYFVPFVVGTVLRQMVQNGTISPENGTARFWTLDLWTLDCP